jgi:hypothetical protein
MKAIQFRDVTIQDINQNDRFDPELDRVTDHNGQTLSPEEKFLKLNSILAEIKATEWKGLSLNRVSLYLQSLQGAKDSAFLGRVQETQNTLSDAEEEARLLSLPFDSKQAFEWKHQALSNSLKAHLRWAEKDSRLGANFEEVQKLLEAAKQEACELNRVYHDPAGIAPHREEEILKTTIKNLVQHHYQEGEHYAKSGRISLARYSLKEVRYDIGKAYQLFHLRIPFDSNRANRIEKEALIYGIPADYKQAEKLASEGATRRARTLLIVIQSHIQQANQQFSLGYKFDQKRADEIMAVALEKGVADNFKLASGYAQRRSPYYATQWLKIAEQYVNEYNQKYANRNGRIPLVFDQARANEILQCSKGIQSCP